MWTAPRRTLRSPATTLHTAFLAASSGQARQHPPTALVRGTTLTQPVVLALQRTENCGLCRAVKTPPTHTIPSPPTPPQRRTRFYILCWPSAPRICLMSGSSHTCTHYTITRDFLNFWILVAILRLQLRPTTDAWCLSSLVSPHIPHHHLQVNLIPAHTKTPSQPTPHMPVNSRAMFAQC